MDSNKPKIGSCSGVHRPEQFSRKDPNPQVPWVDDNYMPPSEGMLTLWAICTVLALTLSAVLIWGPK